MDDEMFDFNEFMRVLSIHMPAGQQTALLVLIAAAHPWMIQDALDVLFSVG